MKRRDLIKHLKRHDCRLDREGGRHSIYRSEATGRCAAIPRHREIKETIARTICDQLLVPHP